ncbi:ras-related protein rab7 [Electrophorus electricus]|uniref:Ras-related protein Rab-7b n=1 Tax=Electrophorus electricus TaxID=8005 RepID=A0A4W4FEG8_ELEEL|nr:ras-related protein rab7 [Electrophorus electricus]XP_026857631.2 ras-related protein rab7 [Electrophorus electricus]
MMAEWSKSHLKVVLVGNSGVGKSSIMTRFVDHRFTNMYRATIGVDFLTKEMTVDQSPVVFQIWDTAGTERFHSLGTSLYRRAHCCLLVFDVTSAASFSALDGWKKEFLAQSCPTEPASFPFIVLGNKTDLDVREVSMNRARLWCEAVGAQYFECSAKEGTAIDAAFEVAARAALHYFRSNAMDHREEVKITSKQETNSKQSEVLRSPQCNC